MKIPPAAKVGLLTLISIAVLVFSLMWLKGRTLATGERFTVQFHDVDGMRAGSMVQLMGMRVGQVENVEPVVTNIDNYVKVDFLITSTQIKIPKGSQISVQQSGIIGEKFLEVTPPVINVVEIALNDGNIKAKKGIPVKFLYKDKKYDIGEVKGSEIISKILEEYKTTKKGVSLSEAVKNYNEISYIITRAGLTIPDTSTYELADNGKYLLITPPAEFIVQIPKEDVLFTTVDPLRIKEFLELQVESAAALKATNDKINQLLEPEQIETLKDTLRNTKLLTATATSVLDEANSMMVDSKDDLRTLVESSSKLSENMITISDNINSIIGEPELKEDILSTVHSVKQSTEELNKIISDPNLKETISLTRETSKNVSELVAYFKDVAENEKLKDKLNNTINNLNSSLDKLSTLLTRTDNLTASQEENVKKIITESTEISTNMKKFSSKLNKHFLLFRLLF